ncbi:hypothetical protein M501DRAFT_1013586 [Patellaria atrata CBS 101060]|uniref:Uncharacterized protein n=1 Tax=Patellaria atrata CBS 101060 TaxID=1346257 RepID=A0A9P4VSN8_9PEZI|nr:hypothetical protein M501DRAFT_1013586 [Patellaria atrata CBS 101060]
MSASIKTTKKIPQGQTADGAIKARDGYKALDAARKAPTIPQTKKTPRTCPNAILKAENLGESHEKRLEYGERVARPVGSRGAKTVLVPPEYFKEGGTITDARAIITELDGSLEELWDDLRNKINNSTAPEPRKRKRERNDGDDEERNHTTTEKRQLRSNDVISDSIKAEAKQPLQEATKNPKEPTLAKNEILRKNTKQPAPAPRDPCSSTLSTIPESGVESGTAKKDSLNKSSKTTSSAKAAATKGYVAPTKQSSARSKTVKRTESTTTIKKVTVTKTVIETKTRKVRRKDEKKTATHQAKLPESTPTVATAKRTAGKAPTTRTGAATRSFAPPPWPKFLPPPPPPSLSSFSSVPSVLSTPSLSPVPETNAAASVQPIATPASASLKRKWDSTDEEESVSKRMKPERSAKGTKGVAIQNGAAVTKGIAQVTVKKEAADGEEETPPLGASSSKRARDDTDEEEIVSKKSKLESTAESTKDVMVQRGVASAKGVAVAKGVAQVKGKKDTTDGKEKPAKKRPTRAAVARAFFKF